MKLFYTDVKKNKKLIMESDDMQEILNALQEDGKRKFIFIKEAFIDEQGHTSFAVKNKDSFYSIED